MNYKFADMHTHSENSHDSKCPVENRVIQTIKTGNCLFAVSDHCDIPTYKERGFFERIANSHKDADRLSKEYNIKIIKGIELGEGIANLEYSKEILSANTYDIILASVHYVNYKDYYIPYSKFDFSSISQEDVYGFLKQYFKDVVTTINTFDFDVMAHLTCPERYITRHRDDIDMTLFKNEITEILKLLIERNIALEINSQGPYKEPMPGAWVLKLYKELGGELITLGSDAHLPDYLFFNFDKCISLLTSCGFDGYHYFENRKPIKILF